MRLRHGRPLHEQWQSFGPNRQQPRRLQRLRRSPIPARLLRKTAVSLSRRWPRLLSSSLVARSSFKASRAVVLRDSQPINRPRCRPAYKRPRLGKTLAAAFLLCQSYEVELWSSECLGRWPGHISGHTRAWYDPVRRSCRTSGNVTLFTEKRPIFFMFYHTTIASVSQ